MDDPFISLLLSAQQNPENAMPAASDFQMSFDQTFTSLSSESLWGFGDENGIDIGDVRSGMSTAELFDFEVTRPTEAQLFFNHNETSDTFKLDEFAADVAGCSKDTEESVLSLAMGSNGMSGQLTQSNLLEALDWGMHMNQGSPALIQPAAVNAGPQGMMSPLASERQALALQNGPSGPHEFPSESPILIELASLKSDFEQLIPPQSSVAGTARNPSILTMASLGSSTSQEAAFDASSSYKGTGPEEKKSPRKVKPIASRFRAHGSVSILPSSVQCLDVVLDYHGYTGEIQKIVLNDMITNFAYQAREVFRQSKVVRKPVAEELYKLLPGEEWAQGSSGSRHILIVSGVLQRKIHYRDISSIVHTVSLIAYEKSRRFHFNNPYEPQYYRYELDAAGRLVKESKCGMCAFCTVVKFLPFKNSSYLSHMTLEHGIFASNYVVPEGLYYGQYRIMRANDGSKPRIVKAVQCPACYKVIEVACWKNKSNPLLSYFRHFKKEHLNLNKTFTSSTVDPVALKQCGTLSE